MYCDTLAVWFDCWLTMSTIVLEYYSDTRSSLNFLLQCMLFVRDEKATLLSQISILQSQQVALGDRIESLSQTADAAMEREREAEERLDQALSVHAHQISQRQVR